MGKKINQRLSIKAQWLTINFHLLPITGLEVNFPISMSCFPFFSGSE